MRGFEGFAMSQKPSYEALEERIRELEREAANCKRRLESRDKKDVTAQKYLDIAGVIIVAINSKGEVTLINKKGCQILGYPEEEIIGKNWFDHFLPDTVGEEVKSVFFKLLRGEIEPAEYYQNPVLNREGEERLIAWYNTLITDESGTVMGTLSSGEDVTERVRAQEELRKAHEDLSHFSETLEKMVEERTQELLETSSRLVEAERLAALGKMANRVAHELRNPLTVIGGFAKRMYEKTADDDPMKRYLRIILKEVEMLESKVWEIIKIEDEKNNSETKSGAERRSR